MEAKKQQNTVHGSSKGLQYKGADRGAVQPLSDSHKVGIHWLRISFDIKYLHELIEGFSSFYGYCQFDGYGLWSYDSAYHWKNGVSLNFDEKKERAARVHLNKCTLDVPGSALDEMSTSDLLALFNFSESFEGKCSRIDIFYDDYERSVTYKQLLKACDKGDFSGLNTFSNRSKKKRIDGEMKYIRKEISFGERGRFGNGKFLRWYDKELESKGEIKADRWEVEFTQAKADKAFKALVQCCNDRDCFALLCGSIVAGCVTFIHRSGDKNISRLRKYSWWDKICEILGGGVQLRVPREKETLEKKMKFVERIATVHACMMKIFVNEKHYFAWLKDLCHNAETRMNGHTQQIIDENHHLFLYQEGTLIRMGKEARAFLKDEFYKD